MSDTERPAPPWPLVRAKVRGRPAAAATGERSDSNESVCGGGGSARLASRPCRGPPPVAGAHDGRGAGVLRAVGAEKRGAI